MAFSRFDAFRGRQLFTSTPVTIAVIGIWILTFILAIGGVSFRFLLWDLSFPYLVTGLFTSALYGVMSPFSLLFACLMMFMFGASLERAWGSMRYLLFLAIVNVATLVVLEAGLFLLTRRFVQLPTPWLLLSSVIVAWAWLNPEQTVMFWFVIPMRAKWIGWITIAILYFSAASMQLAPMGPMNYVMGFFALGGVAVAIAFVHYQRTWGWIPRRRERTPARPRLRHPASQPFASVLRPIQEWQRRRRVAKLQRTFRLGDEDKR